MDNKISTTIKKDALEEIMQSLNQMEEKLPFLVNLAEEDRKGGFRLGDKNLGFLVKTKDYINQKPEFMPGYVKVDEVTKDAVLAEQLTTIYRKMNVLADKIHDTANLAGMEALAGTLAYYNSVKEATRNNAEGAATIYSDLKKRFPGGRKSNNNSNEE